jgi:hypothetical protein
VHVVIGASGAGKSAFIARLCRQRQDWLGLVNAIPSAASEPNLMPLTAGCPCCTGKVVLQITLARALRATRAGRAFVELSNPAHLAGLERVLNEAPLGLSVVGARSFSLPQHAELSVADIER